jgi:leucyl aminopeptidase
MPLSFADATAAAIPLHMLDEHSVGDWISAQDTATQTWANACGFAGALGQILVCPGADGIALAAIGYGTAHARARGRFHLASAAAKLPKGTYTLHHTLPTDTLEIEALGWLLAGYRFDRYKSQAKMQAKLIAPKGIDTARVTAIANGEALSRNLINTPAVDMGPPNLANNGRRPANKRFSDDTCCWPSLCPRAPTHRHEMGHQRPPPDAGRQRRLL